MAREIRSTRRFDRDFARDFARLPQGVQSLTLEKLQLFLGDSNHPSLRVKSVKGTRGIWELSVTMNYRITFDIDGETVSLRRIGTHDIRRAP